MKFYIKLQENDGDDDVTDAISALENASKLWKASTKNVYPNYNKK
jgi:hypothetical protein